MLYNDMHIHTSSSPDAELSANELCRLAPEADVATLGFVAHVDFHPSDFCYRGFCEADYMAELDIARAENPDIRVLRGLEIGEPHRFIKQAETVFHRSRYDFITGALHWLDNSLILDKTPFLHGSSQELIEEYYRQTLEIVELCDVNVLAHMGIFRRGMARGGFNTELNEIEMFPVLMKKILQTMIQRGIALEVNTSGLRRPEQTTYPTAGVLRLYSELGGKRLTIGSDTHRQGNAFFGLAQGKKLATHCGLRNYGIFVKGEYRSASLPGEQFNA